MGGASGEDKIGEQGLRGAGGQGDGLTILAKVELTQQMWLVFGTHAARVDCTTPDLAVSTLTSPKTAALGQPIRVTWTVTNLSPDPTDGDWYDSLYLSMDKSLSSEDYSLGAWLHTGAVAMGESYRHDVWVSLPSPADTLVMQRPANQGDEGPPTLDSEETFYLILVANSVGAMAEIGYTHNIYIIPIVMDIGWLTAAAG